MAKIILAPECLKMFDYGSYLDLVSASVFNRSTTGSEQTPERIQASTLNEYRMKRVFKQTEIIEDLKKEIGKIKNTWDWIVIAESWCGDGAQNVPILAKIAACTDKINFKIVLRDENPALMDEYLTQGKRAIPKLICIDHDTQEVLGTWGPRPKVILGMAKEFKTQNPNASHDEFVKHLHLWYAKDAGRSLQQEFISLITEWREKCLKVKI